MTQAAKTKTINTTWSQRAILVLFLKCNLRILVKSDHDHQIQQLAKGIVLFLSRLFHSSLSEVHARSDVRAPFSQTLWTINSSSLGWLEGPRMFWRMRTNGHLGFKVGLDPSSPYFWFGLVLMGLCLPNTLVHLVLWVELCDLWPHSTLKQTPLWWDKPRSACSLPPKHSFSLCESFSLPFMCKLQKPEQTPASIKGRAPI